MNPHIDVCIQKGSSTDRQYLVDRVRDPKLNKNANVVYIYALQDETVNYPNKPGHVIYIGEAGRPTEPSGKRFGQHISTAADTGGDSGTIYALSRYYWLGKRIRLQILLVESKDERKKQERLLLNAHVKEYGTLPICQGTTGDNYKTSLLSKLAVAPDHLALFSPASNTSLQGTLRDKAAQRP
ncbi:hypothetical protein [Azospira oryzae]|uniref:hypothetical protein n=1 Tax=Azospira oryzae TaxID=146939 RepID=UPI001962E60A|nr:hypothetical protein [Azospira oryzae]